MGTLIFSLNAVLPIILLVALGYLFNRIKLLSDDFLNVGNRLVFKLFLPVMLFYNVYNIDSFSDINWWFVLYGSLAIVLIFGVSMLIVPLFVKRNDRRGVVVQATFRSNNAIIGIPLATALFGAEGAAAASVLSAFSIPLFNALSVVALACFNRSEGERVSVKKILKDIVTNPLIVAVAAGLVVLGIRALFVHLDWGFRISEFQIGDSKVTFIGKLIQYVANVATPFALIVLGGKFKFSAVKELWKHVTVVTVIRLVIVPVLALVLAYYIVPNLGGGHVASYIALFGTPVAVSSAVMAKEMGGDDDLAGQLVVWTTIGSAFTLFAIIAVCKSVGLL